MKTNLFFLTLSLFAGFGLKSQIPFPDVKIDLTELLDPKLKISHQNDSQLKSSTDLQWHTMPSPTSNVVLQTSIACDGSEMVIFYREPDYSINIDMGPIKKWDGNQWVSFAGTSNQCHSPDVDIDGSVVVATWYTDAYDYGYGSNINGPWVSFSGTYLQHQYYPRAAMAMGFPYMSFACRYSDGMPSSYLMLHIRSIIGVGQKVELNGGWRVTYSDIDLKTDIAGDDDAWYCAFSQQGYLFVDKGAVVNSQSQYTDLGDGFRMNNPVSSPEIVVYNGIPVVAWFENGNKEIYVAQWNGSEWSLIGFEEITDGTLNSARMATSANDLYLVYTIFDAEVNISVNQWDGTNWYGFPVVQNQMNTDVSTADIAIYNDEPVVAFTQNNQLTVKIYSTTGSDNSSHISNKPLISCYPNPFQNEFYIDLGQTYESVSYKVRSITGQVLHYQDFERANLIHCSMDLPSGLYFIEINSEGEKIATLKSMKK